MSLILKARPCGHDKSRRAGHVFSSPVAGRPGGRFTLKKENSPFCFHRFTGAWARDVHIGVLQSNQEIIACSAVREKRNTDMPKCVSRRKGKWEQQRRANCATPKLGSFCQAGSLPRLSGSFGKIGFVSQKSPNPPASPKMASFFRGTKSPALPCAPGRIRR
jgi:hypothetical protein